MADCSLKDIILSCSSIVFFGGAGTSTESAIPDFRSETGLYNGKDGYSYPPEVMLSHSFFMKHTEEFFRYYKSKMIYRDALPNPAHLALAELERRGVVKAVITQNIDGLHQKAGSRNVLELHGSVHRNFCMDCGEGHDLDYVANCSETVPRCRKCSSIVKPDVVLYEEALDMDIISKAVSYISKAEVLVVGGTSLAVQPAAGLIDHYKGNKMVLINKSETPYDYRADLIIRDSIGKVLGEVL
jgi:NAD-dependent deacetylase